jgi:hypothetical protein
VTIRSAPSACNRIRCAIIATHLRNLELRQTGNKNEKDVHPPPWRIVGAIGGYLYFYYVGCTNGLSAAKAADPL